MHTPLINDILEILSLGHTKHEFIQIGTQHVFSQNLEDLQNMAEVLFPNLVENQDIIWIHHHEWVGEGSQDVIHQPHEGCEGIR